MPTYLRPGVYVEEMLSFVGPRGGPRAAVDPTTAAALLEAWYAPRPAVFLGAAPDGPTGEPVLVDSIDQFAFQFGDLLRRSALGWCVRSFFACGGGRCWVVRVPRQVDVGEPASAGEEVNGSVLDLLRDRNLIEAVSPFSALAVPDAVFGPVGADGIERTGGVSAWHIHQSMIDVCQWGWSGVAVLDAPALVSIADVMSWRAAVGVEASQAVVGYPRLRATGSDPSDRIVDISPSGALAGLYSTPGPPLGVLSGLEPVAVLDHYDAQRLRAVGITPVMTTLGDGGRVDDEVRLTANPGDPWRGGQLEGSIYHAIEHGTSWVIFRTSGPELWARLETEIASFLDALWRRGHLVGESADAAYDVRCDASTNTTDASRVITSVIFQTSPGERRHLRIVHFLG